MLIGIDASRATKPFLRGTETYSKELIKNLAKIDQKNQYILYSPLPPKKDLKNLGRNFKWKIMPFLRPWSQIRLSFEMFQNPPDVLFEPAHTIPIFHPKNTVVTLHDLGFKYFPKLYSKKDKIYAELCLKFSVRHAQKIIAVSKNTKKDLLKFYDLDPEKIIVIYHGYNQKLYQPLEIKNQKSKIKTPYIYFIGSLEEKKNLKGLIKAYGILRTNNKNIKHQLVLAGKPGFKYEGIKEEIKKLSETIQKDIKEIGYLDEEKAAFWMRNADLFCFPTFFEGFGMPIIEAMASSVPVVCGNTTASAEIGNKAAFQVNPKNPFEIAEAMEKIIQDRGLRESLKEKGLKRASEFSWEKCAKETLEVLYESRLGL